VVDWESGAIAWVAKRNGTHVLIMRGVSDLVSPEKGEAEGNPALFVENAKRIMPVLVQHLPAWMSAMEAAAIGKLRSEGGCIAHTGRLCSAVAR
jgi:hypothetical protein